MQHRKHKQAGDRPSRKGAQQQQQPKRLRKDPGVPNLVPFKAKLLEKVELNKRKAAAQLERHHGAVSDPGTSDRDSLAKLVADASRRAATFDSTATQDGEWNGGGSASIEAAAAGRRDNSKKAYHRELRKVVEAADVILEILDARDPMGCRAKQLEELIINSGVNKRIILVMNKIDLIPRENLEHWLKILRSEFPTIAFKSSTQSQRSNLGQSSVSLQNASENNYSRNCNIKTSISVGVVGFPNVGKSSVINSLKRSKACNVGSTPGVTKVTQEIHLDKNIKLLDCPGIVFSKSSNPEEAANVVLRNCIKVELIEDPIAPVDLIVSRCNREQLMQLYNIPYYNDTREFLVALCRQRGRLRRGGIPDVEGTARAVIQDWNTGRIPFYSIPPTSNLVTKSEVESSIVATWSKEFELSSVVDVEGKDVLESAGQSMSAEQGFAVSNGIATAELDLDMADQEANFGHADWDDNADMGVEDVTMASAAADSEEPRIALHAGRIGKNRNAGAGEVAVAGSRKEAAEQTVERLLNPQVNRDRRLQLKARKRQERRAAEAASVVADSSAFFGAASAGGFSLASMEED
ncbi:Guanine nucleotide-binding protein-like 3 [Cladochytrium tenue]|nr:Guanine nucleotide-binding protein-like 3 [Cladochytrium tenue]